MTAVLQGLVLDPSPCTHWQGEPIALEGGGLLPARIGFRHLGLGRTRILLLHALTGGPCPEGPQGYWGPLFEPRAPLDPSAVTVWAPNLPGSCYGSVGPGEITPFPAITPRDQAQALAHWIVAEDLRFEALLGGSLGGMVALELALLLPDRFATLGVIGCGARSDAWVRGANAVQARILESALPDAEAVALARQAAMLTFRAPESLNARFGSTPGLPSWLQHHGEALAARFTRASYRTLLAAMDAHDVGRGRGGVLQALEGLGAPVHVLGLSTDTLFTPPLVLELVHAVDAARRLGSLAWIVSPHGHDAFLIEWEQIAAWLEGVLPEAV
jgi:homoserine O-acetyltransferase